MAIAIVLGILGFVNLVIVVFMAFGNCGDDFGKYVKIMVKRVLVYVIAPGIILLTICGALKIAELKEVIKEADIKYAKVKEYDPVRKYIIILNKDEDIKAKIKER